MRRGAARGLITGILCWCLAAPAALATGDRKPHLPAPRHVFPSWNSGFSQDTALGRTAERWGRLHKKQYWDVKSSVGIAGFRVYEKHPNEGAFRLTHTVDLSVLNGSANPLYITSNFTGPYTGMALQLQRWGANAMAVHLWEFRHLDAWPVGTYEQYVAAYDAQGREGRSSPVAKCTYLGAGQMLLPTPGSMVNQQQFVASWMNPALQLEIRQKQRRYTVLSLWGGSAGTVPLYERGFSNDETSHQNSLQGIILPGQTYHAAHVTIVEESRAQYCPCISVSPPVSFVMQ